MRCRSTGCGHRRHRSLSRCRRLICRGIRRWERSQARRRCGSRTTCRCTSGSSRRRRSPCPDYRGRPGTRICDSCSSSRPALPLGVVRCRRRKPCRSSGSQGGMLSRAGHVRRRLERGLRGCSGGPGTVPLRQSRLHPRSSPRRSGRRHRAGRSHRPVPSSPSSARW